MCGKNDVVACELTGKGYAELHIYLMIFVATNGWQEIWLLGWSFNWVTKKLSKGLDKWVVQHWQTLGLPWNVSFSDHFDGFCALDKKWNRF